MVGVTEIMAPASKGPMHALMHSLPPTLQQATADLHLCWRLWTLMGKSGSVSCGVAAPFSCRRLSAIEKLLEILTMSIITETIVTRMTNMINI